MFLLALLAFFAIALPDNMLGVAWPFMRVTFNQPLAAMSLVLPFGVAATLVSTSSWTWAAARLGLGRLLAASLAMSTAGLLLTAVAPAYWVVVACAVLFGLSAGAVDAALNAYAARHFGPRRINLMHAAYGVGAATSPLIITAAVSFGPGWRGGYLAVMILQGLLAVLFTVTARQWTTAAHIAQPGAAPTRPTPASARSRWQPPRRAVAGVLVVAVNTGLETVVALWGFVYLLEAVALSTGTAGLLMSGYWVALVIGRVVLGAATERIGIWPMLAVVTIGTVLATALVATRLPVLAGVGVIVLGLAVAPIYPLLILTTSERTASASVDRLVGFQAGASTVGAVTFTALVGLLMEIDIVLFGGSVLVLAILSSTGIWLLRPGRHRPGTSGRQRDDDQGEKDQDATGEKDAPILKYRHRSEGDDRSGDDGADASGVHVQAGRQTRSRNHLLEQGEANAGDSGEAPGVERLEGQQQDRAGDERHRHVVGDAGEAPGREQLQAGEAEAELAHQNEGGDLESGGNAQRDVPAQMTSIWTVSAT